MTFRNCFKASSYCLIGSGFAAVMVTGAIGTVPIILFSAVFIMSWFAGTVRIPLNLSNRVSNTLALSYILFFVIDYLLLSRSLFTSLLHFLLFATAMKLLSPKKDQNYVQLYFVSFSLLLTAAIITASSAFMFCFLTFLVSGIGTLILFEMRKSDRCVRDRAEVSSLIPVGNNGNKQGLLSPLPAGLIAATTIVITIMVLAGTIPFFILVPRIVSGMNRQPSGETQFVSGFSEKVELGRIGSIRQSDQIVMRVKTAPSPEQLLFDPKWRGLAFDYFDGQVWERSDTSLHEVPLQGRFYKLEDEVQGTNWITQTFFIEPLSTNVIFSTPRTLAVSRDVGLLRRDSSDSFHTSRQAQKKLSYTAISDPVFPDPSIISDYSTIPADIREKYLQLPQLDPGIAAMAEEITATVSGSYAKARRLEHYLRSHYEYSLDLDGIPGSKDPLAVFLLHGGSGHCEYFASAMTIMLRQTGIPARLVNGFRSGQYNRIGGNWTVRQYDAHSWVEAYFLPYGWLTFDPTPGGPPYRRTALGAMLSDLSEILTLWWWDGIVNYDTSRQYRVINSLHDRSEEIQENIGSVLAFAREKHRALPTLFRSRFQISRWSPAIIPLLILLVPAGILSIRPVRKTIFRRAARLFLRRNHRAVTVSFYDEALELLAAEGYRRDRHQTPLEFAESLTGHPSAIPFMSLTRVYNTARFAPSEPRTISEPRFRHSETRVLLDSLRDTLKP
jgi:protein-glutamine gamma-glutamyltransferase